MTDLQDANYISNADRTEGEGKQFLEDLLAKLKEVPGGAAQSELTIVDGVVTPTGALHSIDTESDDSSDTLTNIALDNLSEGSFIYLWAEDSGRTVTVQHLNSATDGEIFLIGEENVDLTVDTPLILKRVGAQWIQVFLGGGGSADEVDFDPSGLTRTDATDVQEALEDHDAAIDTITIRFVGLPFYWPGTSPPSWALERDGNTIGNASSNATARAHADTWRLFSVLWTAGWLDIYDSGGSPTSYGAGWFDDYSANKQLALPDDVTGNRFSRAAGGSLSVGDTQAHGAPNITGGVGTDSSLHLYVGSGADGAFSLTGSTGQTRAGDQGASAYYREFSFDASDSPATGASAAYGSGAEEVRPNSRAYLPCIIF